MIIRNETMTLTARNKLNALSLVHPKVM